MKRSIGRGQPQRGRRPLRAGTPPARRTRLARGAATRLRPTALAQAATPMARRPMAASQAQRAKIIGGACVVCRQTSGLTPAHLAARAQGGCEHEDCVVPLCWVHHRAYDTGRLDLLGHLEPRWRTEIAHAVGHLGLIGAYRRLTGGRFPSTDAHDSINGSRCDD